MHGAKIEQNKIHFFFFFFFWKGGENFFGLLVYTHADIMQSNIGLSMVIWITWLETYSSWRHRRINYPSKIHTFNYIFQVSYICKTCTGMKD